MMSFTVGADDYVSRQHLPRTLALPEKILVTLKLDQALNLERVMMTDLKDTKEPPHAYCDAHFESLGMAHQMAAEQPPQFSGSSSALPGALHAEGIRPSATEEQIRQLLKKEDGTLRTGQEVLAQIRHQGLGTDTTRVYAMLRNEKGPGLRKNVPDEEIRPYLRNHEGLLLTRRAVESELRNNGIAASAVRINILLQAERMANPQAQSSRKVPEKMADSQIKEYLNNPDGTLRTRREVARQIRNAGLPVNNTRINALLQAERGVRLHP